MNRVLLTLSLAVSGTAMADPPTLADDLRQLREEEKLARDLYLELAERWDSPVFRRIAQAEQRHMDHVGELLRSRGIDDPVGSNASGVFSSPVLRELHRRLLQRGRRSEVDAYLVGAEVEDLDIADLRAMRARTRDPEVLRVHAMLECGSENHLRAFDRQLRASGHRYEPRHLTSDAVATILAAPHEPCGRRGGGRAMRGGMRGLMHGGMR